MHKYLWTTVFLLIMLFTGLNKYIYAGGLEYDTNRHGGDYRGFEQVSPDPNICKRACERESRCKSFSYVKPGIQTRGAKCWLKDKIPGKSYNKCCVSGVIRDGTSTSTSTNTTTTVGPRSGFEYGTNRPGMDYKSFFLKSSNPVLCKNACDRESRCKAYTYVKAGIQGANPKCWLKHSVPPVQRNNCCVSGVKSGTSTAGTMSALEYNTNRRGLDYKDFNLNSPNPALCQRSCSSEYKCKAFTYVKPGYQGPKARCWLKHSVPRATKENCCVSGYKR